MLTKKRIGIHKHQFNRILPHSSISSEGFWLTKAHTANWATCKCEIESSNSKKYCTFKFTRCIDGESVYTPHNFRGISGNSELKIALAKKILKPLATTYQVIFHTLLLHCERNCEKWNDRCAIFSVFDYSAENKEVVEYRPKPQSNWNPTKPEPKDDENAEVKSGWMVKKWKYNLNGLRTAKSIRSEYTLAIVRDTLKLPRRGKNF